MSVLVPMASIAEDPMVIARVATTVAVAADHLKVAPPELTPAALGHQLASLRQRLEQRIALPSDPTADWATTAEILIAREAINVRPCRSAPAARRSFPGCDSRWRSSSDETRHGRCRA